ncbi:MAG: NUDIX hydrolase [Deltaproteobacteria bacterium]|nr:NUDIX hydrolase [Deltaproteobacteria bacterium]
MKEQLLCPNCGKVVEKYRNPFPTVDIIIETGFGHCEGDQAPLNVLNTSSGANSYKRRILSPEEMGDSKGNRGIILIKRKNPPFGWALPGGFVDYGESLESAAMREAEEETSLKVELLYQLGAYSDPARDPRHHTISVVFVGKATGQPKAADDAVDIGIFDRDSLPDPLAFDHQKILSDYFRKCYPKG